MEAQTEFDERSFNKTEQEILNQVMDNSKAILESFKFRMIFCLKVDSSKVDKTLKHLKEFRNKNWDKGTDRKTAYKKYLSLY
ncbi:hypothetical protein J4457_03695 [Candidatus Woesearchaeota archaeon]|nr:hypothetical protein [Candidatus Woesearchaeota archaeon]